MLRKPCVQPLLVELTPNADAASLTGDQTTMSRATDHLASPRYLWLRNVTAAILFHPSAFVTRGILGELWMTNASRPLLNAAASDRAQPPRLSGDKSESSRFT